MAPRITRRELFMTAAAAGTAALVTACPRPLPRGSVIAWKRCHRGKRVSNAEKKHNANHVYRTQADAMADAPHPGARSTVCPITLSRERFDELFFHPGICCVDLRTV